MTKKANKNQADVISEAQESSRWTNLGNRTRSWMEMSPGEYSRTVGSPLSRKLSLVVFIIVGIFLVFLSIATVSRDGFSPIALEFIVPAILIWAWVVFAGVSMLRKRK